MLAVFPDHWAAEPQWRGTKAGRGDKESRSGRLLRPRVSRGSGVASLPACQAHVGSTVDTASGQRAGEPRASGGHFTKWSASCSEGGPGPLALEPGGVQL